MLSLQQVANILNKKAKAPDNELLQRGRDVYYGISLHTTGAAPAFDDAKKGRVTPPNYFGQEYQKLFDLMLLNRHPREDEATRNWRYSQYRPFTKDPFIRVMEVVTGAIFQDSNYTIELKSKEDNDYIWGNTFSGYDLVHYFERALQSVFEDPNGYFVRIPKQPGHATTTPRIEPDVWFVNTKDIIAATQDELIFQRDEYVWLVNKVAIFRFEEREAGGATQWVNADPDGYYAHNFGYIPADIAGGIWNSQGFYNSWLDKGKAAADDFISSKSAEQLVDKEASHPFITQAQTECAECNGVGKINQDCDDCDGGVELVRCHKCKGSGYISNNPGQRLLVPAEQMTHKLIDIQNPDVGINKNHREKCKEIMLMLLDALHLLRVDEAQSGVAKALDQERLYQFVSKISNDLFDRLIYNTLRDIIAYRNVRAVDGVVRPAVADFTIIKPTQFQIKTAADLLAEIEQTNKAGVPGFIRSRMMVDFVDKQFGGDYVMKRKAEVIAELDPVCALGEDEKSTLVLNGAIERRDWQFSAHLPAIIDALIREKGKNYFLQAPFEALKLELQNRFDTLIPKPVIIDAA